MSNTDGEDTATKDRIEKDATTVLELTKGFTPEQRKEMGNMLTSLEEMAGNVQILCQKLKQERNKAIDEAKALFNDEPLQFWRWQIQQRLESLKDKSHE